MVVVAIRRIRRTGPLPRRWSGYLSCLLFSGSFLVAGPVAADKSGVTPNRLNLPDGPGSLPGVGENVEMSLNMGLMVYQVPLKVPAGYSGATPSLALVYNSGAGSTALGIGWNLPIPTIERMTSLGLPSYALTDRFVANGSEELVQVASNGTYRARYEGGFIRYSWLNRQQGREGYWKAEYPDGRIGYFGATADGTLVPAARADGVGGAYRYHLVELVDVFGHRIAYEYEKVEGTPKPIRIAYAFENDKPRHVVRLDYEPRPDPVSDGKSGSELRVTERLAGIELATRGKRVRHYQLAYESVEESGGFSRLKRVQWLGADSDEPFPVRFEFAYSAPLGIAEPRVLVMGGSTGVDLRSGTADLVDLNADSLPDLVDTGASRHRIFLNELTDAGGRFAEPVQSTRGALDLTSPNTELFDLDGNGTSDMVDAETRTVLWNQGAGDWESREVLDELNLPNLADDADAAFLDYDNNKSIDLVHIGSDATWVYANRGGGQFELVEAGIEPVGVGFQEGLQLADMNGDGLQDPVRVGPDLVAHRLNLGLGRWSDWLEMANVPADLAGDEQLVDLNGDSLSDLVAVRGDALRYAINVDGRSFGDLAVFSGANLPGLPERNAETSVRFADMNGSGTTDVVYFNASGAATFVELFPTRPNLLSRIDNGIGKVIEVAYGSTAEHLRRDGGPSAWQYRLPHPMLTVDEQVVRDELSGLEQRQTFHYANGFYDGVEKQFRGFADVSVETTGDSSVEIGKTRHHFDVGADDPYRKGLLLSQTTESNDSELSTQQNRYDDCALDGVGNASPRVRFICPVDITQTIKERSAKSQWVTLRQGFEHDAYGNQVLITNEGVVDNLGDESFNEARFIRPGSSTAGHWLLNKPEWRRSYGVKDSEDYRERRYFYDSSNTAGELVQGLLTRVQARVSVDPEEYVDRERFAYDAQGTLVESIDANGHRRTFEYDSASLLLRSEVIHFDDRELPYALRMNVEHHPVLETVTRSSSWMLEVDGKLTSTERATQYAWSSFSQLVAIARPGDTLERPTETFAYEIAAPFTSVVHARSSQAGGDFDLSEVQCLDGLGRKYQVRTRLDSEHFQVSGFEELNTLGKPRSAFQPYVAGSATCDRRAPDGVLATELSYDATGRELSRTAPDVSLYGSASQSTTAYLPLSTTTRDPEDNDPESDHRDTPVVTAFDGLGRTVLTTRTLATDVNGARSLEAIPLVVTYNRHGNLRGYVDANGNEKSQEYDLLDRVVLIDDPDSHTTLRELDAIGNVEREVDARGTVVRSRFDEANRLIEQWQEERDDETRIVYTYDRLPGCERCTNVAGKLARVTYPTSPDGVAQGEDAFGYDDRGHLIYTRRSVDGHVVELTTELDNAGRTVARNYPTGHRLEYQHDGASRIVAVPGFVEHVGYEDRGPPSHIELANGVTTDSRYDELVRLLSVETLAPKAVVQRYTYVRDRAGNILANDDESARGDVPSANATYAYDSWYRLISAHLDAGHPAEELLAFAYDPIDNIQSKTSSLGTKSIDHVGSYVYGKDGAGPHAVSSAGKSALAYDAAGNMTLRGQDEYSWDFLGRMTSAQRGDEVLGTYIYGPDRQRIKKEEREQTTYYFSPDFEVRNGTAFIYVTLGSTKVARIEVPDYAAMFLDDLAPGSASGKSFTAKPDGQITAADAWIAQAMLRGVFEASVQVNEALVDELLVTSARRALGVGSEQVTYYHFDHSGSAVATSNARGAIVSRASYYPFGQSRGATVGVDYGYTGKEADDTGMTYFGSRFADPRNAQWLSPDPAFAVLHSAGDLSSGMARYSFARCNPVNYVDPDGQLAFLVLAPVAFRAATGFAWHAYANATVQYMAYTAHGGQGDIIQYITSGTDAGPQQFNWQRNIAAGIKGTILAQADPSGGALSALASEAPSGLAIGGYSLLRAAGVSEESASRVETLINAGAGAKDLKAFGTGTVETINGVLAIPDVEAGLAAAADVVTDIYSAPTVEQGSTLPAYTEHQSSSYSVISSNGTVRGLEQ